MKIFEDEYGFMLTVGASTEIADLCPDGDLNRMGELLEGRYSQTINFTASFIAAMAKGFDDAKRFAGEEVTHKPLTAEMVKALPSNVFKEVQAAALAAFKGDTETTVEVKPSKKKGKSDGIVLNLSWFLFYGRMLHMSRREIMSTRYGEMSDMISCFAIYNGAEPKKRKMSFDEALNLR